MSQPKHRQHHGFSSADINATTPEEVKSQQVYTGKRYIPSWSKLHEEARNDYLAGKPGARCCKCGKSFAFPYVRLFYIALFEQDWVCKMCAHGKDLKAVK